MQGQINSYSFPIANQGYNSFITPLKSKSFLLACGVTDSDHMTSQVHKFNFVQENPKKSYSQSRSIRGQVLSLESGEDENQQLSCIVVKQGDEFKLQKLNLTSFEGEQQECTETIHKQSTAINSITFKKDLRGIFLGQDKSISLFDVEKGVSQQWVRSEQTINSIAVDYLHQFTAYTTSRGIVICDKKSNNQKYRLEGRSGDGILGAQFNPTKQFCLMTCHHEALKIWDIRKGSLPVKCYDDHQNLLVQAKYHPCHDQLIACAYDDGSVALLRLCSVCSSPQKGVQDSVVKLYDQHEDSVFKLSWSAFSSWVFATVTYDCSTLAINLVPQVERYRILL